jgi:predicted TIM-barrel fold metal-dependent hydrolase
MIIDFHVHIFPDKIAKKAIGNLARISGLTPFTDGTIKDTVDKFKSCGVDKAVFLNIATKPSQMTTINDEAARLNRIYENFTSFGSVYPDGEKCLEELERIKSLGIKGIKLHPDYQGFFANDKKVYPVYDLCCQLDIPVVMHTGWDCYSPKVVHAAPVMLREIALEFPHTRFVFAHMGSLRFWDEVEENLTGLENVYFDTSFCVNGKMDKEQARRMILKHPGENTLFGSDCPWEDVGLSVSFVESLNISDDLKERIFYLNASNLLKSC